jgi:hypothetical protein
LRKTFEFVLFVLASGIEGYLLASAAYLSIIGALSFESGAPIVVLLLIAPIPAVGHLVVKRWVRYGSKMRPVGAWSLFVFLSLGFAMGFMIRFQPFQ